MEGDLPGYSSVWYHPSGIANLISLGSAKQCYRITFDSEVGNKFLVTKPDGTVFEFKESPTGLYYIDAAEQVRQQGAVLISTVADNKSNYINADYLHALGARKLQIKIGNLTAHEFMKIVSSHLLPNCPITREDIKAAKNIFWPDVGESKKRLYDDHPIWWRHTLHLCLKAFMNGTRQSQYVRRSCLSIPYHFSFQFHVTSDSGLWSY